MKKVTIACNNIKKSFTNGGETIEVLHDVNLTAYENEMIMLMGPSGSGKTTLISIIGGILDATSGTCLVLDHEINKMPEEERTLFRGNNIGFLFQHFILVPTLNAIENTAIPLLCMGSAREPAFQKASKLLSSMDLDEQQKKKPNQLSGGEQQRVAIARGFIHDPKILLCDEPTSFLDLERGKKIMAILQAFKEKNQCTIIVVTHDPRILPFADRIIRIEDGRIKEDRK